MQLIYEGKDITSAVEIKKADIVDNAGGIADSLEVHFNDPNGLWSKWKPEKNNKVQIKQHGFDSGLMYVDEIEQHRGAFIIKSLSIPQEAKTTNTKAWEEVRFMEIVAEISAKYAFKYETYGIQNYLYKRVDQYEKADCAFLSWRCALEGYILKITDNKVVVYDERYVERQAPARIIYADEFDGKYWFRSTSTGIYGSCSITYEDILYKFNPSGVYGPALNITDLYVSSLAEAERFSKGLLRFKNKFEFSGYCAIKLDTRITAGNTVHIQDLGFADGKYFCEQAVHKLADRKTYLRLRRPLEGY